MAHRKWKETKQLPSILPGPAVPGCCLVYFHFLWAIQCPQAVHACKKSKMFNPFRILSLSRRNCYIGIGTREGTSTWQPSSVTFIFNSSKGGTDADVFLCGDRERSVVRCRHPIKRTAGANWQVGRAEAECGQFGVEQPDAGNNSDNRRRAFTLDDKVPAASS